MRYIYIYISRIYIFNVNFQCSIRHMQAIIRNFQHVQWFSPTLIFIYMWVKSWRCGCNKTATPPWLNPCTCTYTCTYTRTYAHTHRQPYLHDLTHVHTHTHMHTHTHTHSHMYICIYIYIHIHTHTDIICSLLSIHIKGLLLTWTWSSKGTPICHNQFSCQHQQDIGYLLKLQFIPWNMFCCCYIYICVKLFLSFVTKCPGLLLHYPIEFDTTNILQCMHSIPTSQIFSHSVV